MLTTEQIRSAGLEALQKRLGRAGMIRFLQLNSTGHGDYTKERQQWVEKTSLRELISLTRQMQSTRRKGRASRRR